MTPPPGDAPNDPRALARKLVEDAKARALAKKLAEQAKARVAAAAPPKASAPAKPKKSLSERAKKPMSAKEALRRAIEAEELASAQAREAEEAAAAAPAPAPPPPVATPAPAPAPPVAAPAPVPTQAAAPTAPVVLKDPAVVIANRLPGVTVRSTVLVDQRPVFKALWTAHRARAQVEARLDLMVTADVLTDAANRLPEGALYAARATRGDEVMAVWVDVVNGVVLGIAEPAEVFLAGL